MTKERFDSLPDGTLVWFRADYLAFPMLGVIRTIDGVKGVWVNFFGEGQCLFTPPEYKSGWHERVSLCD